MSTISEAEYERRIAALEKLNAKLAAEIDRQRPVVQAAVTAVRADRTLPLSIIVAVNDYESSGGKDGADE